MTLRDQLHEIIEAMRDDTTKPQLHANVDALPDADLPEALDRMRTFRQLLEEQAESGQHDIGAEDRRRST